MKPEQNKSILAFFAIILTKVQRVIKVANLWMKKLIYECFNVY